MTSKTPNSETLAVALFSEIFAADQLSRSRLSRVLPKGMELSHFAVLNHLMHVGEERSPAQLAQTFHLTRGAMTNTLTRLEWAGHIHVRPDWDDARKKRVAISTAGRQAVQSAIAALAPIITELVEEIGLERVHQALPVLRELRDKLSQLDADR